MIYITGDTHGDFSRIANFCARMNTKPDDIMIILGDAGINFYGGWRDLHKKEFISKLPITLFCIHGNHEIRPANIPTYKMKEWNGGMVWYEEQYPNILFAKDGEIFEMDGLSHMVIGGAYSVDKYYRIARHYGWWPDEQPSEEIKTYVEQQFQGKHIDVILSHTCPFKYEPVEAFLPMIDQSTVDASTEMWLDKIEAMADYDAWLCGHWHISKRIDKLQFMYHDFICSDDLKERAQNRT